MSCFVVLFSVLLRLQLSFIRPNRSQVVRIELSSLIFLSFSAPSHKIGFKTAKIFLLLCGFKTYLVRRRTKTQKYKGALFEQLESG